MHVPAPRRPVRRGGTRGRGGGTGDRAQHRWPSVGAPEAHRGPRGASRVNARGDTLHVPLVPTGHRSGEPQHQHPSTAVATCTRACHKRGTGGSSRPIVGTPLTRCHEGVRGQWCLRGRRPHQSAEHRGQRCNRRHHRQLRPRVPPRNARLTVCHHSPVAYPG